MGQVREYEGMEEDLKAILGLETDITKYDGISLSVTDINKNTKLLLTVRPVTFDVFLNEKLICSCNEFKNAYTIYRILKADIQGKVWHG